MKKCTFFENGGHFLAMLLVVAICCLTFIPQKGMAQTAGPEFTTGNSRIKSDTIVLNYGACDAFVTFSESMFETDVNLSGVDPSSYSINPPDVARYEVGTHTVEWTIRSNGRDDLQLEQTVVVYYPRCGTDSLGQTAGMYHATIDGEQYATVRVGCDCWLAENLRHTHYIDGTEIPNTTYYNNDVALLNEFGRLYTWDAAVRADASGNPMLTPDGHIQGACPEGWAIPTVADFLQLATYAGGADHLKSHDPRYWLGQYGGTTPGSGFDALPGGYYHQMQNSWRDLLGVGYFWTSGATNNHKANCCELAYYCPEIMIKEADKTLGYSVRCIAEQPVLRSDTTVIACDSFVWHGTTYNASGDYEQAHTGADGLMYVNNLHLTVNKSTIGDTTVMACDSFTWHLNDSTYKASTTDTCILTNANAAGCDSLVILHLTINHPVTETFTVGDASFTMVLVEGGTFWMGAQSTDPNGQNYDADAQKWNNERPVHQVTLTQDYWMGETEVTQALWYAVMGQRPTSGGSQWSSTYGVGDNYPAYCISWNDIKGENGFIDRLNDSLSSQLNGRHFDLPTEAQWEFAARGGTESEYFYDNEGNPITTPNSTKYYKYAGSNNINDVAWYEDNARKGLRKNHPDYGTHVVKTKSSNELGLYNMSGNVWEWCSDWFESYGSGPQINPTGPAGRSTAGYGRVLRGGSWSGSASHCRVSYRGYGSDPASSSNSGGFRLVLSNGSDTPPATVPVTGVSLNKSTLSLIEGAFETLVATVTPENATNQNVDWASDNTAVATVDNAGKVTAVSAGSATITVTTEDGGKTATCAVTVNPSGGGGGGEFVEETLTFTVNGVDFVMKPVTGGTFWMGAQKTDPNGQNYDADAEDNENPVHQVTLSDYYMGETEVTQALWQAVTGQSPTSDGSQWSNTIGLGDDYPAYYISWNDIQSFLTALNAATTSQRNGRTFAMPTEAQWEFAAREGSESEYYYDDEGDPITTPDSTKYYKYAGSNTINEVAWYDENSGNTTHPVRSKFANELGLYDMSGNVWEWCRDRYGSYGSGSQNDPQGSESGDTRVLRGGSWYFNAMCCRVSDRYLTNLSYRNNYNGFRLVLLP